MKWFGKSWGAPVCTEAEQTNTPVGEECGYCAKLIEAGDTGLLLPFYGDHWYFGTNDPPTMAYHHACFMQAVGVQQVVHVLVTGYPLCGFSNALPKDWPVDHRWVSTTDSKDANCPGCKAKLQG
jgi:hypothetical protein